MASMTGTQEGETTMARSKITNEEQALEAVKQDGRALEHVPLNRKKTKLFVPEELMTPEICLVAVKEYGGALRYVPENLKTPEICLEAVKNLLERDLEIVPEALRDEVRAALKNGA